VAIVTVAGDGSGRALVRSRRVNRGGVAAAAACLIASLAFLAFLAGEHQQHPFTVLTGTATVGDHQATVIVAGWAYAIGSGIPWVDQQGVTHEGGWPSCLGPPGRTVPVAFGEVPVTAPGGQSWRQVVWLDCRA
jgi:hypothetical protein